jgi:hypothetical protein
VGVDLLPNLSVAKRYANITYQSTDFEQQIYTPKKSNFDLLWCHDAFQYATNPISTLRLWWSIAKENSMLVITVPHTVNLFNNVYSIEQASGCYYHHTLVSLIHMLAVTGWDCRSGFFKKLPNDPWVSVIVYRSSQAPMDPKITSWYTLAEKKLLPESVERCINQYGYLKQQELVLPWIDKSLAWYGQQ